MVNEKKKKGFLSGLFNFIPKLIESKKQERTIKKKLKSEPIDVKFSEVEKISGDLKDFEGFLKEPSKIGIILGARGSGKTALGMRILENIHASGKKVFTMGFKQERLPKWINNIQDVKEVPNDSFLLADESGIGFSSRNSMSSINKLLTDLLLISRHKNISIIFITQNSSNVEVNTLRQADYLLLKPSSLLQMDFERKKIKDIYSEVQGKFKKHDEKGITYIYSDLYRGFVKNILPSFWTDKISKSFSG